MRSHFFPHELFARFSFNKQTRKTFLFVTHSWSSCEMALLALLSLLFSQGRCLEDKWNCVCLCPENIYALQLL